MEVLKAQINKHKEYIKYLNLKKLNIDDEKEKLNLLLELQKEQNLIISLNEIFNDFNEKN